MVFSISPAVTITETDLSTVIPAVSSTPAAFVGPFQWGPVDEINLISSENELVTDYGEPDANTFESFFSAANFLSYGSNLQVVRVVDQSAANAYAEATALTSSSSSGAPDGLKIKNAQDYETKKAAYADAKFAAKYPGVLGNSLAIVIIDATAASVSVANATNIEDEFDALPSTSDYATSLGASSISDEIHIAIIDEDGAWTGTQGTILEKWAFLSKASDSKRPDGSSNYYVDVLNNQSKYIWWLGHPENAGDGTSSSSSATSSDLVDWGLTVSAIRDAGNIFAILDGGYYSASLSGGVDDNVVGADDLNNGWALFADSQTTDVSLLVTGPAPTATAQYVIDNVAEVRKDCVAFVSPLKSDVVDLVGNASGQLAAILDFEASDLNRSSSYAVVDSGWKYQYDRYNDTFRYVPLNGDIAGLCARTDLDQDPWYSPAGFNRGQIKNVSKLAYNPVKADRDELYKQGINPVVELSGQGTILYGDKTLLARPSAFDRINVRRLFIVMEKSIATAANFTLFEFNDEFTRAQFINQIEPFLRNIQSRNGITDFRVVCDSSNNTADVIDRQEFVADIYVKPNRAINFITLNFIATRSGISFSEIGA